MMTSFSSSTTARCLSVVVLLLSLAPLGSLYFLMTTLEAIQQHSFDSIVTTDGQEHSLQELLENPQLAAATLDQVWGQILLLDTNNDPRQLLRMFSIREATARHLSLILPWAISIFLGVVLPACLSIASFVYRREGYRRQQEHAAFQKKTQERRRGRVLERLNQFTKTLHAEDHQMDGIDKVVKWRVPSPGVPLPEVQKQRENASSISRHAEQDSEEFEPRLQLTCSERWITEPCAVCLNPYEANDSIIWSPNTECRHCFHASCIIPWLIRKPAKDQRCPCCRQRFVRPTLINRKHANETQIAEMALVNPAESSEHAQSVPAEGQSGLRRRYNTDSAARMGYRE